MPQDLLTLWSDSAPTSAAIWAGLGILLLYLARRPCHDLLIHASRGVQRLLRTTARLLVRQAEWVLERNREVLVAVAEDQAERVIERDFRRISRAVDRDLSSYPALHRALSDQISRIDEDYRQSADAPPTPPAWLEAVQAVAAVEAKGDPAVAKILEDMHSTLQIACHNALLEYRATSRRRHLGLKRMLAYWRRVGAVLESVQRAVGRINDRAAAVDEQMHTYEEIRARKARTVRVLQSSSLVRFLTASLVLALAGLGAAVNYQLVYLPLGEILRLPDLAGLDRTEAAAIGLIAAQLLAGIALTELLGITRLFHFLGITEEPVRRWGLRLGLALLLAFAALESGLAWSAQADAVQALDGDGWVPGLGHALLGFVLPLALAPVGLALEAFLQSGRIVSGLALVALLRGAAVILRLLAVVVDRLALVLLQLYDVVVFLPLRAEEALRRRTAPPAAEAPAEAAKIQAPK